MGLRIETAALLDDWGNVVRKVGAVPSYKEYEQAGSYSWQCFPRRFQRWSLVPAAFYKSLAAGGLAGDWADVLEMIQRSPLPTWGGCKGLAQRREAVRAAYEARAKETPPANEALVTQDENRLQSIVPPRRANPWRVGTRAKMK